MSRKKKKRRTIVGLKKAELLEERPTFIPEGKYNGVQMAGIRYEKRVADRLKNRYGEERVWHGPWFQFEDKHGAGFCSPDILIFPTGSGPVIIGECKLTVSREAERQLKKLYVPVVKYLWPDNDVRPVQIARNLKLKFGGTLAELEDVMDPNAKGWPFVTFNWRI